MTSQHCAVMQGTVDLLILRIAATRRGARYAVSRWVHDGQTAC